VERLAVHVAKKPDEHVLSRSPVEGRIVGWGTINA
jgi:hypothetical protein